MNEKDTQLEHSAHTPSGITYPLSLIAHDIEDATNVGSLFRLADALGIEHLYLTGSTVTPPDRKLGRTSRSTDKAVVWRYESDPVQIISSLRIEGYTVIALELSIVSIPLQQIRTNIDDKFCLLIGNESKGLCDELLDIADMSTHIPMLGQNSSMNVAMATAIASWALLNKLKPTNG